MAVELPHTALAQHLHQQAASVQNAVQAAASLVERQQQQWRQQGQRQQSVASPAGPLMLPDPGTAAAHSRAAVAPSASPDAALNAAADKLMAAKRAQLAAVDRLAEQVLVICMFPCPVQQGSTAARRICSA